MAHQYVYTMHRLGKSYGPRAGGAVASSSPARSPYPGPGETRRSMNRPGVCGVDGAVSQELLGAANAPPRRLPTVTRARNSSERISRERGSGRNPGFRGTVMQGP